MLSEFMEVMLRSDLFAGPQISSQVLIDNHALPNLPYGRNGSRRLPYNFGF